MNNLIEIKKQVIDQETVQMVNARELHVFLEVGKKFADWIY
ncbi:anti-repressor protein [Bartonella sp. WD12.1]|nr:anti-repressor protein [Bartonella sp. WD12.1]